MMGADAPIPPVVMNAAAPDGAPPRRIRAYKQLSNDFHDSGANRSGHVCSPEQNFSNALISPLLRHVVPREDKTSINIVENNS